jgi:flagellin-like hook-associated protein FlgL
MLVNNFMHNLGTNLQKVDKLQTQLANNSKFAHISDDPISVIYGRNARYNLHLLEHYNSNLDTGTTWLTKAEDGLMSLSGTLGDAYTECIDSATDSKTAEDRQATAELRGQLKEHMLDALNSALGDRFVFGAYNTTGLSTSSEDVIPPFTVGQAEHLTYKGVDLASADADDRTQFMRDLLRDNLGMTEDFSFNDDWHLTFKGTDIISASDADIDQLITDNGWTDSDVAPFTIATVGTQQHLMLNGTDDFSAMTDVQKMAYLGTKINASLAGTPLSVDPDLHLQFTGTDMTAASEQDWKQIMSNTDPAYVAALGADFGTVAREHLKFNDIDLVTFSRYNPLTAKYDVPLSQAEKDALASGVLTLEMGPGIYMDVTLNGVEIALFDKDGNNIYNLLDDFYNAMMDDTNTAEDIAEFVKPLQDARDHILALTARTGGRANRIEMLVSRYEQDYLNYTQMKSDAEDADEAELIMMYEMARMVYEASLKTGASIMQMSLLDFLS